MCKYNYRNVTENKMCDSKFKSGLRMPTLGNGSERNGDEGRKKKNEKKSPK